MPLGVAPCALAEEGAQGMNGWHWGQGGGRGKLQCRAREGVSRGEKPGEVCRGGGGEGQLPGLGF